MKKHIRRLSLVVAFAMLAVFVPLLAGGNKEPVITVSAASDFTWNGTVITGYTGSGGSIGIPSNATEIGSGAFAGNTKITAVTLPESVTKIGYGAFQNCTSLTNVYGAQGVTYIDTRAFYGCTSLVWTNFSKVEVIGSYSFIKTGLDSINIPKTTRTITMPAFTCKVTCSSDSPYFTMSGDHVLLSKDKTRMVYFQTYWYDPYVADQLYSVPTTVTTIGTYAFYNCVYLDTITLPSTVTTIEHCAFGYENSENNIGVKDVYFGGSQSTWNTMVKDKTVLVKDMVVHCGYDIRDGVFYKYSGTDKVVDIPDGVTAIGDRAFYGNTTVEEVYMPLSCESVGVRAFYECTNLVYGNISSGVKSIGSYAYNGCTSLEGQFHSYYCESIGQGAFLRCPSLEYMNLSTEMKSITFPCFECEVWVNSYNKNFTAENGILFNKDKTKLLYYPPNKYDSMAFEQMYNVPKTVTTIGRYAFYKCSYLDTLAFPKYVTTIEDYAFGDSTASNTFAAKDIYYGGTHTEWNNMVSGKTLPKLSTTSRHFGYEIEDYVLTKFSGTDTVIEIPYGVTEIGRSAFENNTKITEVYLESTVKKVGDSAFYGCSKLSEVSLSYGCETIENYAFNGTAIERFSTMYVKTIGMSVFLRCPNMTSIDISNDVTSITFPCFDCNAWVSSYNKNYSAINGALYDKKGETLYVYPGKSEGNFFCVPAKVKKIGKYAFSNAANLKAIAIPVTVTEVEDEMFGQNFSTNTVAIKDIYYGGTQSQWNALINGKSLPKLSGMTVHFNTVIEEGKPIITKQPANTTIALGKSLSISVEAQGENLLYQWYYKKSGQTGWTLWKDRTNPTEKVTPNSTWDGIQLYCKVTNGQTQKYTDSNPATVMLTMITQQPKSQTIKKGSQLTLSLKAKGPGLTYQWYFKKKDQTSWSPWNGHTSATESCTPNDTWEDIKLYCLVKDNAGNSINSDTVTIRFGTPLKITEQPKSQTIKKGSELTISVKAEGTGLTYQWYYKKSGATGWSVWSGRTHATETCTPNDTWDGIQLYCKVKDGAGATANSNPATIKFGTPLKITGQPKSQTIKKGSELTISVKAEGTGLTYQWYYKKKGQTSWTIWSGRTHATEKVTPNDTWDGIQLYCKVKDGAGATANSNPATIKFGTPLKITEHPKSQVIKKGSELTISVKAEGTGLTYQWYYKKKGQTSWTIWSGRTNAIEKVTPNDTWDGIQLYCKVKDGAGATANSNPATIKFGTPLKITEQPKNQTITLGQQLTVSLKAEGTGTLTYQWYYMKSNQTEWNVWTGRTHATETCTPNATWNGIKLYCEVKDSTGSVKSNAATITVK